MCVSMDLRMEFSIGFSLLAALTLVSCLSCTFGANHGLAWAPVAPVTRFAMSALRRNRGILSRIPLRGQKGITGRGGDHQEANAAAVPLPSLVRMQWEESPKLRRGGPLDNVPQRGLQVRDGARELGGGKGERQTRLKTML